MRVNKLDHKITKNFSFYEFVEGKMSRQAIELNWEFIDEMNYGAFTKLAEFLQGLRDEINIVFKGENNGAEIGLTITSGFRCRNWEFLRGRSGNSQHTLTAAADIVPSRCTSELSVKIIDWMYKKYNDRKTGYAGGFAIKKPTRNKSGGINTIGFAHFDVRDSVARWEY